MNGAHTQIPAAPASTEGGRREASGGVGDVGGRNTADAPRRELAVSISVRTILMAAVVIAAGAALASIKSVLLLLFVSIFSVAVLSPVATAMERRLGWSRRACAMVLVVAIVGVIAAV